MRPKNKKRLILAIGLVMALSTAAIWLAAVKLDKTIADADLPKNNQRQFSVQSKPLQSSDNRHNRLYPNNNPITSHLPKGGNSDPLSIAQQKEYETQNEIFEIMSASIREGFPELDLSEAELMELNAVIMEIRESIQGLRRLERKEENVELFRQLEDRRDQALWDFERITGMGVVEFLRRVPGKGGITYEEEPQAPVKFKYLDDFRP